MTSHSEAASAQPALDLLSISQTDFPRCTYGAPLVAIVNNGFAEIKQSCCNHWDCEHCGQVRAAQEYRRIVAGAEKLAEDHKLYFWTLTCRGRDCSLEEAEENYLAWTNTLLTNARTKAKRALVLWCYAQITERQHKTRLHPHSHILATFLPDDAVLSTDDNDQPCFVSAWFSRANASAGLGSQHKITEVKSAAAVSRYVAKYMFKASMTEEWPPHWRRVRYSQNWPQLEKYSPEIAIVLTNKDGWKEAERMRVTFVCESPYAYESARHRIANIRKSDVLLDELLLTSPAFTVSEIKH